MEVLLGLMNLLMTRQVEILWNLLNSDIQEHWTRHGTLFQNSKFLQFVSKMSSGELIIDDNQVKPASENWATEYQQQYNGGASWADEFAHDEASRDIVEDFSSSADPMLTSDSQTS
ncbi:hypothetical protein E1A91_A05G451400v1 [Gossypium mustelinum]|uniref:Uncharacterized protein n=1 Tax=Gossypium mustelinum TaxID=34275 RepID=A0A5D2ZIZ5_GOSMU|nr:hypothetical protein E1A91_A05G451400v1 [Gossypium mustelinum]